MKYVIDIPDDIDFVEFYKSKNNKFLENRDIVSISTLEKYEDMTEAEKVEIEEKTWDIAWEILNMGSKDYNQIFDEWRSPANFQEVKIKYNRWKLRKELKMGDEVVNINGEKAIILKVYDDNGMDLLWSDGSAGFNNYGTFYKTGRHFPEIAEALNKLNEVYKNETT
jgi:hypothetical protein